MELRQKIELRRILAPELRQSLKLLSLPLLDLKTMVEEELVTNPLLEEVQPKDNDEPSSSDLLEEYDRLLPSSDNYEYPGTPTQKISDFDFRASVMTKKVSLQEALLRQLGMFSNNDEELKIGQEIIGNLDENGYLKITLEEIACSLKVPLPLAQKVLLLIQKFEPVGIAARDLKECLLIQLRAANSCDPLTKKIVENHLDDIAKKKYKNIARCLKEPLEKIEPIIKRICKLNPKPGINYSLDEAHRIIPDIVIEQKDEMLEVTVNNESFPTISINKAYRQLLKKGNLDPQTKEFLTKKLQNALELLRAIAKRQTTLRKVIDTVVKIQTEAILQEDFSLLKPLTLTQVAKEIEMHESTVSRVVINKYVKLPQGMVALKDFFSSCVHDKAGQSYSSNYVKSLIAELISQENQKKPLSDQDICTTLSKDYNLNVSRRTVTKYREELKILSSPFRKQR